MPDCPLASPDARHGAAAVPGPRRSGPPARRRPAPGTGRHRHCRSGCAPPAHRFSPSAPRHPGWTGRHRAHADARTARWTPRPARRSSPSARAAGRGAGSPCGRCGHPPAACWCAAPDAIPPAGEPVPRRCRGPAHDARGRPGRRATAARRRETAAAPAPAGTTSARPNSSAANAERPDAVAQRMRGLQHRDRALPAAPGTPSTGVNTCSRQLITRESSWWSASRTTAARHPAQLVSARSCTTNWPGIDRRRAPTPGR